MRKTVLCLFLFGLLAFVLLGCNPKFKREDKPVTGEPAENQFDATVLEIQEGYLMVQALEGQLVVGEVQVWIGLIEKEEIPTLSVGDEIRITHDGKMTMSLPPQTSAMCVEKR